MSSQLCQKVIIDNGLQVAVVEQECKLAVAAADYKYAQKSFMEVAQHQGLPPDDEHYEQAARLDERLREKLDACEEHSAPLLHEAAEKFWAWARALA